MSSSPTSPPMCALTCTGFNSSRRHRVTNASASLHQRRTAGSISSPSPASPVRGEMPLSLPDFARRVRRVTDIPVYAGFGIATPEQAQSIADLVDGVIVGSRAIEVAEDGPAALRDFVRSLRAALDERTPADSASMGATFLGDADGY